MDTSGTAAVRDLISGHPLQRQLQREQGSWTRICRAIDAIEDLPSHSPERLDALNTLRSELGMEAAPVADDIAAAIQAGLETVSVELGDRVNAHREQHSSPLLPGFQGTSLESTLRAFVDELRERGHDDAIRSDAEDALHIVQRATQLIEGEAGLTARDVVLLVSYSLPRLLATRMDLAKEIDEETGRRQLGWLPPLGS